MKCQIDCYYKVGGICYYFDWYDSPEPRSCSDQELYQMAKKDTEETINRQMEENSKKGE